MSLFKLGVVTVLLSDALISGYTAAAAFSIVVTQMLFLFGLNSSDAAVPTGLFITPRVSCILQPAPNMQNLVVIIGVSLSKSHIDHDNVPRCDEFYMYLAAWSNTYSLCSRHNYAAHPFNLNGISSSNPRSRCISVPST